MLLRGDTRENKRATHQFVYPRI